jgi:hypothetical protein
VRDGNILDDDDIGGLREAYSQLKRAANAAGYHTDHPTVQAALIAAHGVMSVAGSVTNVITRVADEMRRDRRSGGGWRS